MERPLCPLCKTKHFAREPHIFGVVKTKVAGVTIVEKKWEKPVEIPTSKRWDKKSYNAYMKEYMKLRRAVKSGRAMLVKK